MPLPFPHCHFHSLVPACVLHRSHLPVLRLRILLNRTDLAAFADVLSIGSQLNFRDLAFFRGISSLTLEVCLVLRLKFIFRDRRRFVRGIVFRDRDLADGDTLIGCTSCGIAGTVFAISVVGSRVFLNLCLGLVVSFLVRQWVINLGTLLTQRRLTQRRVLVIRVHRALFMGWLGRDFGRESSFVCGRDFGLGLLPRKCSRRVFVNHFWLLGVVFNFAIAVVVFFLDRVVAVAVANFDGAALAVVIARIVVFTVARFQGFGNRKAL
jgi:hypothetical protein